MTALLLPVACDTHTLLLAIPFAGPPLAIVGGLLVMAFRDRRRDGGLGEQA